MHILLKKGLSFPLLKKIVIFMMNFHMNPFLRRCPTSVIYCLIILFHLVERYEKARKNDEK